MTCTLTTTYRCDHADCKAEHRGEQLPEGWRVVTDYVGPAKHACPRPVCQRWIKEYAEQCGLTLK